MTPSETLSEIRSLKLYNILVIHLNSFSEYHFFGVKQSKVPRNAMRACVFALNFRKLLLGSWRLDFLKFGRIVYYKKVTIKNLHINLFIQFPSLSFRAS